MKDEKETIGGAMFCDELLAFDPDALNKLKAQKKTLHGLYRFAESWAYAQAVANRNGEKAVGVYASTVELLAKYLSPDVKEGYTIPKPKSEAKKTESKPADKAKEVVTVVKKAAEDAKKEKEAKTADLFSQTEAKKEESKPEQAKPEQAKPAFEQLSLF